MRAILLALLLMLLTGCAQAEDALTMKRVYQEQWKRL